MRAAARARPPSVGLRKRARISKQKYSDYIKTRLSVVSIVSVSCSTVFVSSPELDQYLALILCIAAAVLSIKTSSQCGLDLSIAHCQGEQRMQSTHFIQLS